ncbi:MULTISPECIES: signal peptidase I [Paenibacillus]|uniref:Signal peptidase I n=1 Tax=Paenibacillus peoriae TaxID=59893 RepID=A0A7H0YDT0_9BACL|nr:MULTISPECIES: signal peptidase I [Paenibacillus]KOS01633.1 signal peptidase I [Paenibacillus polymyxa]QNR69238.1 signal peptidase I [Paenibacillus peoriae]
MEQEVGQGAVQQPTDQDGTPKRKPKNEIFEWLKAIIIALVLVFLIRWLLFKPFIVDGPSMQPNFHTGERVIVNEILYDFRAPKPGEVIVFHVPEEGRDFIKRVIAVEGDTVKVEGDTITVNGKPIQESYLKAPLEEAHQNGELYNKFTNFPNEKFKDGKVPAGHIFVMGDNRSNSTDSRMLGYIDLKEVVGRADVIFWPAKDMQWINH